MSREAEGEASRKPAPAGFTIVETLLVIVVMSIVAVTAIALLSRGVDGNVAEAAAKRLASDVEYARMAALAHRSPRLVIFDPPGDAYEVHDGGGLVYHPVTRTPFQVDFQTTYSGSSIDLSAADFGGSDTLRFDGDGVPAKGGQIVVDGGETSWTITVSDSTGRVVVSGG